MILLVALLLPAEPVRADADGIPLPPGAVARLGSVRFRLDGAGAGYVSPDGRVLFTANLDTSDDTFRVSATDTATGRPLYTIDLPPGVSDVVRVSGPAAGVVACECVTNDGVYGVWRFDAATGFPRGRPEVFARGVRVPGETVRSPGGKWLVEAFPDVCRRAGIDETDSVIRLREIAAAGPPRELLRERDAGEPAPAEVAVSGDDGRLALVVENGLAVRLYDLRAGRWLDPVPLPLGGRDRARRVAFLPDSRLVVCVSTAAGFAVLVADPAAGRHRTLFACDESGAIWPPRVLAGGRLLAVRGGADWVVIDVATGERRWQSDRPLDVAFTPDGRTAFEYRPGWVTPIDLTTGQPRYVRNTDGPARRLAFLPDGRLAVRHDYETRVWDAGFRSFAREFWLSSEFPRPAGNPRWSPDGRLTVPVGGPVARVLEAATGKPRFTPPGMGGQLEQFAFSPDGRYLATHERDGIVYVWDLRRPVPLARPTPAQLAAAIDDLGSADAAAGFRAVRLLAAFPDLSLPALRDALPPAAAVPGDRVRELIADLDAPRFADRQRAARELAGYGTEIGPAIRDALARTDSAEARSRLEPLAAGGLSAAELRVERAVEAVEWMATPAADALLARWASGAAGRRLTTAAAAAAARRGRR